MKVFFFVWCRAVSAEKLANQKSHSVERKLKQHLRVWWRPMKNMGGSPRRFLMADVSNLLLTKMLNKSTVTSPQCCTPPILFYFSFSYIPWMSRRHLSYLWTDVFTEGEEKKKCCVGLCFKTGEWSSLKSLERMLRLRHLPPYSPHCLQLLSMTAAPNSSTGKSIHYCSVHLNVNETVNI